MLADILSRSSKLPVTDAVDGMVIQPDHVYVMPSNTTMRIKGGALVLKKRPTRPGRLLPIDSFLESLADELGRLSIGVVLSGTGTDGMRGLAAIQASGGLTYAEDPSAAEYDGMPRAAIDAGVADVVLDPEGIAAELTRLGRDAKAIGSDANEADVDEDALRALLDLVRQATGLDLTSYRRTTLLRRISRRMLLEGSDSMSDYLAALESDPTRVQELYRDVLVNMTQFFRDPAVLDALVREALPEIIGRKEPDAPIRIWVPGCSKGQEAYSILMVIVEALERSSQSREVQMFASDVNGKDIDFARAGVYPESLARDVSSERLARFFTRVPGGYQVSRSIREMCVFATHDITQDPPFSKLDVVSFRNVLIYMERPLQEHVLQVLHYALLPGGFLVLGTSESVGSDSPLFDAVDKKAKIYTRRPGPARLLPRRSPSKGRLPEAPPDQPPAAAEEFDVFAEADRVVQRSYQPAGLVLSPDLDVIQFRGNVGRFLAPSEGPPQMKLSRLVPDGLAVAIEAAVREANKSGVAARRSSAVQADGGGRPADVAVIPMTAAPDTTYYLVLMSDRSPSTAQGPRGRSNRPVTAAQADELAGLRRERDEMQDQLEAVIAERESANADLRAVGERLLVSNEELRTINEEFQTAQEELQSTNEELTTLNDELRNRNNELVQLADDLSNVIEGVEIPILILSRDLCIRRFTPQSRAIVNIEPTDVGRPLTDLSLNVDVPDLRERVADVLERGAPSTSEVRTGDGGWHSMRIRPYKTTQGQIDGVVIAFIDVHDVKANQASAEFARQHAEAIVETIRQPLVTLGADLTVSEANSAFYGLFGGSPEQTLGVGFFEIGAGEWDVPELRRGIESILSGDAEFAELDIDRQFPGPGRRIVHISGRLVREDVGTQAVLLAIDDITVAMRRQALTTALNDIGMTVASTLDFRSTVEQVLKDASESLGAESAALLLRQEGSWVMKSVYALSDDLVETRLGESDFPVALHALRTGEPRLLLDLSGAPRFASSLHIDPEHRSALLVPIVFNDEPIGSLSFHFSRPELIFTEADDSFARHLATMMAFALDSAELYAIQKEIAETLQGALLSLPGKLPGIEFGYLYRSAAKAAAVGGDFYDMFELDRGRVGILIGDVSGKGVRAATLTALVKNTIRALAYEEDSPAKVVAKASEVILRATTTSMFVTLLFAVLDTHEGAFVYCSAGHTTGLIRRGDGTVDTLEVQSPLVGALEGIEFEDGRTVLGDGDTLVVYTDGVTEARRGGAFFGQEGLVSAIQDLPEATARTLPRSIFKAVQSYAEGKLSDDVAIIAVTRKK